MIKVAKKTKKNSKIHHNHLSSGSGMPSASLAAM